MNSRVLCALAVIFLFSACSPQGQRISSQSAELTVMDYQILDYRGNVLLTLSQLPNRVQLNPTTEFTAHERFVRAEMSPDGNYLAVTSAGSAHGAAWVYRIGDLQAKPAAFQYGGRVRLGLWHPQSTYLVVRHQPPSGAQLISVTEVSALGTYVESANQMVRAPQHDRLSPQSLTYNALSWEDRGLRFNLAGQRWLYDPTHGVTRY